MKRLICSGLCSLALAASSFATEGELTRTPEHDYDAPTPGQYSLPVIQRAGDGDVLLPDGQEHSLSEFTKGRVTVLSFIYTRCARRGVAPLPPASCANSTCAAPVMKRSPGT